MNVIRLRSRGGPRPSSKGRTRVTVALAATALMAAGVAVAPVAPASAVAVPTWTQLSPATSPPAVVSASMAYDPTSEKLVLFGGQDSSWTFHGQTWTYDGSTWTDVSPTTSPPARADATMVYDAAIDRLVLFGGDSAGGFLDDTWTYDASSNTWAELTLSSSPPAREQASMAYDGSLTKVVLFGGLDDASRRGDTWTFDGSTWTQHSVTGPSARFGAMMAFDPDIGKVVLFGGYDGAGSSETWTYDGSAWTHESPAASPPSRRIGTMAYDAGLHQVLLFGGYSDALTNDLGDTWTYDGSTWTAQLPATSPGLYEGAVMAYDQATGQMILFGGYAGGMYNGSFRSDTWAYALPTVFPPDAPAAPIAVAGNGQVALSWTAPADGGSPITGYAVAYKPTLESSWTTVAPSPPTNTSTTITGLTNGTSYDFQVAANNAIAMGDFSPVTSATPSTVPNAPTMPELVAGSTQVQVSWSEPPTGGSPIAGYTVAYRVSGAKGNRWSTVTTTETSTTVTGLTNNVQYVFKVLATNANGASAYSPEAAATPFAANAPGVPAGVLAVAQSSQDGRSLEVVLTWTASGSAATDHEVTVYGYRAGTKGTPTYRVVVTVRTTSGDSTYTVTGLSLRKEYAFSVAAGNADGWSVPSTPSNAVGG